MQRVWEYLYDFWSDWVAIMSGIGSVTFAVINTIKALPTWSFWLLSALCFVVASFRVWLIERKKVEALLNIDKATIVQRLTELANRGTNCLQNRLIRNEVEVYHLWADYGVWEQTLISTMEQYRCSVSDITRIKQLDAFTPRGLPGHNAQERQVKEWIAEKVARLRDVVERIESR